MADKQNIRRLAAIVAIDVAGYSRLMGANEEGTLSDLKTHRREIIDPKVKEYGGRIVKTTGDGILVEFATAIEIDFEFLSSACSLSTFLEEIPAMSAGPIAIARCFGQCRYFAW